MSPPVFGTLTWGDGDLAPKIFAVTLQDDSEAEGNESLLLDLTNPTGGIIPSGRSQALLTIVDNDLADSETTACPLSGTIDMICNAQGQTLNDVTVTESGVVHSGFLSGTLNNAGEVNDLVLQPGARLRGGIVSGVITSASGTVADVRLSTGTRLRGGSLEGAIDGAGLSFVENLTVQSGTVLSNLIIGDNVQLPDDTVLGKGVRFARSSAISEGLSVLSVLPDLDIGCGVDEKFGRVDLSADVLEGGPGILNAVNALQDSTLAPWQTDSRGNLYRHLGTERQALQPVLLTKSDRPAGVASLGDQAMRFVTDSGLELLAQPAVQDPCALHGALMELGVPQLVLLENGNLQVPMEGGAWWYSARPEEFSSDTGTAGETALKLRQLPRTGPLASISYPAATRQREQVLYPALAHPEAVAAVVDAMRIGPHGVVTVEIDGNEYDAVPDYVVVQDQGDGVFHISLAGDLNADGIQDFTLHYADGTRQNVFMLPLEF